MIIGGLQKTSLLDFPEKIAAIVFTMGCDFRCGYCHNPELINGEAKIEEVFEFLKTRQGKLDGVVITGGEPCLQKDLPEFIKQVKELGFAVKLDTNGSFPEMLEKVLPDLDYVAMDIKAPLEKYSQIVNVDVDTSKILKSIEVLKNGGVDYEFRTTVVKSQLSFEDFEKIGQLIQGAPRYYLQRFEASKILDKSLENEKTYSTEEFERIIDILKSYVKAEVRY
ncbi:MAG: anaerobic ribonucleoside-triphosphate reductase activating protein [Brachyspira sp.]|nr:anaerobic ribonucleoside-triphosphate reductase activating protein [Brachyspira sp.]